MNPGTLLQQNENPKRVKLNRRILPTLSGEPTKMVIKKGNLRSPPSQRCFRVNLDGTDIFVTVTATASIVRRWIKTIKYHRRRFFGNLIVGLGVQWNPDDIDAPADTLQLCVGRRCLVYQLSHSPYVPNLLRRFLMNCGNTFVGFWNHSDRSKLENSMHRLEMKWDPLEMRTHEEKDNGVESLERASIQEIIVQEQFGIAGVRMREEDLISAEQILQLTHDAHRAFEIGKNIKAWRFNQVGPKE